MSIAFEGLRDVVLVGAGAVGTLTLEHGWGWVLAQYHARAAKAKAQATDLYAEINGQVKTTVDAALADKVDGLNAAAGIVKTGESRLAALEQKVFGAVQSAATVLPPNKL